MSERAVPQLHGLQFDSREALDAALDVLRDAPEVKEVLPLVTCQRNEVFVVTRASDGASERRSDDVLTQLRTDNSEHRTPIVDSRDAALRLFQITSGALSHVPGERAIAHQLRAQLRQALKRDDAGSIMATLVRRALNAGDVLRERVERDAQIIELTDLVAMHAECHQSRPITLLGAGSLGQSINAAIERHGLHLRRWATRTPRADGYAKWSIANALNALEDNALLITALDGGERIACDALPRSVITIDLGVPQNIRAATWPMTRLVSHYAEMLQSQAEAVERAAHRLPARAEAALAETICPRVADVNRTIAGFRKRIVDAELARLASSLDELPADVAERVRRSIRHAAARSVHPLHEYVNALGRQGRVDDAQLVVDHLLGSRVGWSSKSASDSRDDVRPAQSAHREFRS